MLGDQALVEAVLEDYTRAPISEREKKLFAFVVKVNRESVKIGPRDIDELHQAGWTDEAIYDAITICALFNFYNRWIDATGVHEMPAEAHRAGGKRLAQNGYIMTKDEIK
ncbi:MAG: carboxymuconolactone decarboxylase family protein [Terriglobia bacterium]